MQNRLKSIEALALDVDGTLTDGGIYYGPDGVELKRFDVKDGYAIAKAITLGLKVVIISGRSSKSTLARALELGIASEDVIMGRIKKDETIRRIARAKGVALKNIAFIGDDSQDIPAMEIVGIALAVEDASSSAKERADIVIPRRGGHGAVRHFLDTLALAKGWGPL